MSGKISGVQAEVKELYPLALYIHCSSHVVNLVISIASELGVIGEVCTYISRAAHQVRSNIEKKIQSVSHQRLKLLCQLDALSGVILSAFFWSSFLQL